MFYFDKSPAFNLIQPRNNKKKSFKQIMKQLMKNYFAVRQTGEEGGQGSNFYYFRRIKPEAANFSSLQTPALLQKKKKATTKL